MLLSTEERNKFVQYLEESAHDDEKLVEQLSKVPQGELIAKKYRIEAMAAKVIAKRLRETESVSL